MTRDDTRNETSLLRELRARSRDAYQLFTATDAETVAWRRNQAEVDADIEGLARDERAAALMAEMDREGVPDEVQIERLKAHFAGHDQDGQTSR